MRRRNRSSPAQKYVDGALSKAPDDLNNTTPKLIPKLPDQAANSPVSKIVIDPLIHGIVR